MAPRAAPAGKSSVPLLSAAMPPTPGQEKTFFWIALNLIITSFPVAQTQPGHYQRTEFETIHARRLLAPQLLSKTSLDGKKLLWLGGGSGCIVGYVNLPADTKRTVCHSSTQVRLPILPTQAGWHPRPISAAFPLLHLSRPGGPWGVFATRRSLAPSIDRTQSPLQALGALQLYPNRTSRLADRPCELAQRNLTSHRHRNPLRK